MVTSTTPRSRPSLPRIVLLCLITAIVAAGVARLSGAAAAPERAKPSAARVGLWIECEGKRRSLDDRKRLVAALDHAEALGATDLFVQVYRDGRAWFPTKAADDAPWRGAKSAGFDPLTIVIDRAHRRGARVHAWVNLLRVGRPAGVFLLRALGDDAILSGTGGTARGFAWGPDTPGAWLDPSSPEVGARLAAVLGDLVRAYPALDGVHLDYARYPIPVRRSGAGGGSNPPGGFAATTAEGSRFLASAGGSATHGRFPAGDRTVFASWRRDRLTELVRGLRRVIESARPGILLSAAVMPEPGEAATRAGQDWPRWAEEGILDLVVPMNYAPGVVTFERAERVCLARRGKAAMFMGIGAWRMGGNAGAIVARTKLAIDRGAEGAVLFSHDNLTLHPGLFRRIGRLLEAEGLGRRSQESGGR